MTAETLYIEYLKYFITVEAFALYYGISVPTANKLIAQGKSHQTENLKWHAQITPLFLRNTPKLKSSP